MCISLKTYLILHGCWTIKIYLTIIKTTLHFFYKQLLSPTFNVCLWTRLVPGMQLCGFCAFMALRRYTVSHVNCYQDDDLPPHAEDSESGSTDLIESGSGPDPNPKH
jgi:hypothetical protein